jgi:hypothetical protein
MFEFEKKRKQQTNKKKIITLTHDANTYFHFLCASVRKRNIRFLFFLLDS